MRLLAEIDVAAAASCNESSAFVRELRDARSRKIKARATPIRVPAGVYSIGVSCGAPLNGEAACADISAPRVQSDVPAYELVLQAGRRYVFSCARMKDQDTIRLSESTL